MEIKNKYEYRVIEETDVSKFTIDDINKAGNEGWRVVQWIIGDNGYETVLLERCLS